MAEKATEGLYTIPQPLFVRSSSTGDTESALEYPASMPEICRTGTEEKLIPIEDERVRVLSCETAASAVRPAIKKRMRAFISFGLYYKDNLFSPRLQAPGKSRLVNMMLRHG